MASLCVCMLGAFRPDYSRNHVIRTGLERVGIEVVNEHLPRDARTWGRVVELVRRSRNLAQCDVLLVPAFNQLVAPFVWAVGNLLNKPVLHDFFVGLTDVNEDRGEVAGPRATLFRWIDHFNAARMTSITDTAAHREAYRRLFKGRVDDMSVIPIGVNDDLFGPRPLPDWTDGVRVQFVGTFIPFHGVDVILRAIAHFRDDPRVQFEFFGQGQTHADAIRLAEELKLQRTSFAGFVPPGDLVAQLTEGTILLGVFGEGEKTRYVVPNKLFEGMALGRPIITAESPAMNEFFTPGEHFISVPAGDPERLAEAIRELIESRAACERLASAAAARIQEAFLPQHIGALLKPILEEMAGTSEIT